MKKSLTKVLVSCAAVMSVAAMMSVSASAADVTYANGTITNGATVPVENGKQATILVVEEAAESALTADAIKFIDQQEYTGTNPWATITATLENGNYVLKMGGEGVTDVVKQSFKVGDDVTPGGDGLEVLLGDVNMDWKIQGDGTVKQTINYKDAQMVLDAASKKITLTEQQKLLANVDQDEKGTINYKDAQAILDHASQKTAITAKVTVNVD